MTMLEKDFKGPERPIDGTMYFCRIIDSEGDFLGNCEQRNDSGQFMKNYILLTAISVASISCGKNELERARRETAAANHRDSLEYRKDGNNQSQRYHDLQDVETGVQFLDFITSGGKAAD